MPKNKNLPINGKKEPRAYSMPDLKADPTGNIIEGHAAVFGQEYIVCEMWKETIARGAFDKTDFKDVIFDVNHDMDMIPLARSRNNNANSTLQLKVDDKGLYTRASLDVENNTEAKALYFSVDRGDMDGMSYIFIVRADDWTGLDTDMPSRVITDISKVFEVSVVSFPCNDGTDINARSADALESAKKVLESARATELESSNEQRNNQTGNLEFERLKAEILLKL
jgi:HK97 family phage prohead protease